MNHADLRQQSCKATVGVKLSVPARVRQTNWFHRVSVNRSMSHWTGLSSRTWKRSWSSALAEPEPDASLVFQHPDPGPFTPTLLPRWQLRRPGLRSALRGRGGAAEHGSQQEITKETRLGVRPRTFTDLMFLKDLVCVPAEEQLVICLSWLFLLKFWKSSFKAGNLPHVSWFGFISWRSFAGFRSSWSSQETG